MLFEEVIGQTAAKGLLRNMVENDRIPHALLFLGPQGCGKLALALAFAQYLLCEEKSGEDACGKCRSCSKASKLIHPDLHFSFPVIGTNVTSDSFLAEWRNAVSENVFMDVNHWLQAIGAQNKQGNINKEECVRIIRKLSLKAFEGRYKILVLWLPEYLGKEGNRLLKLIEEPPGDTILILAAENRDLILNTILSRCQLVKINQLSDSEVVEGLCKKANILPEKARSIAHLADGNFNEALKIATQSENDNSALFLEWMRKSYLGNGVELMKWVEKFAALGRENQKQFLRYALHFLREYLLLKMTAQTNVRLAEKELATALNLTKVIEFHQVEAMVKLLTDCSYYIERNANPKVLFLDTSIQMNKILKNKMPEVAEGSLQ